MTELKVTKLCPEASLPAYGREGDACMDIAAAEELTIAPGAFAAVGTGLAFEIPAGYEMRVSGRSGLAAKYGVGLVNGIGIIDEQYRGEVRVILSNRGNSEFRIEKGMRIAQIALFPVHKINLCEVDEISTETNRGTAGFGSSGM